MEDSFDVDFGDASADFDGDEISLDIDHDPPEPIEAGAIDIGELVAQYLSLALDPHPRAPGASLDPDIANSDGDDAVAVCGSETIEANQGSEISSLPGQTPLSGRPRGSPCHRRQILL